MTELLPHVEKFAKRVDAYLVEAPHVKAYSRLLAAKGDQRIFSQESLDIWQQVLTGHPQDDMTLHHMAIINHGLAIQAEQSGSTDLKKLKHFWGKALECWSALWRSDSFWDRAVQQWQAVKKQDPRADLFKPGQWVAFRQRMPEFLLAGRLESARAALATDKNRAKTYVEIIKKSGFAGGDCNRMRGSLYEPYRPDLTEVESNATFKEADERLREYLTIDDDYGQALRDSLAVLGGWLRHLRGKTNASDAAKIMETVAERGQRIARHPAMKDLVASDISASQDVSQFYMNLVDYLIDKVNKATTTEAKLKLLDPAWGAAKQAALLEKTGNRGHRQFFDLLSYAVDLRLRECADPKDPNLDLILGMIHQGLNVDSDEPHMVFWLARAQAVRGDKKQFKDLLDKASALAATCEDQDLVAEIKLWKSRGPDAHKGLALRKEGIEAMEQEEYSRAQVALERCLKLCPNDAVAEAHLGQAYRLQGRQSEGLAMLRQARQHARDQGASDLASQLDEILSSM